MWQMSGGGAGPPGPAGIAAQRTRQQTNTSGVLTWAFSTPFDAGVIPVITAVPEASSDMWDVRVQSVDRFGVTLQATRTTVATVLSVSVLSVVSSPQCWLHVTATPP